MLSRLLEVVAGDTLSFRIVLRDGVSAVDASAIQFSGGVRNAGGNVNIVNFTFDALSGPIGVVRVTLTPDQTARLQAGDKLYEWYVRIAQGDYIKTLGFGALRVIKL